MAQSSGDFEYMTKCGNEFSVFSFFLLNYVNRDINLNKVLYICHKGVLVRRV